MEATQQPNNPALKRPLWAFFIWRSAVCGRNRFGFDQRAPLAQDARRAVPHAVRDEAVAEATQQPNNPPQNRQLFNLSAGDVQRALMCLCFYQARIFQAAKRIKCVKHILLAVGTIAAVEVGDANFIFAFTLNIAHHPALEFLILRIQGA